MESIGSNVTLKSFKAKKKTKTFYFNLKNLINLAFFLDVPVDLEMISIKNKKQKNRK